MDLLGGGRRSDPNSSLSPLGEDVQQGYQHAPHEDQCSHDEHLRRDAHLYGPVHPEREGLDRPRIEVGNDEVVDRQREGEQAAGKDARLDKGKRHLHEGDPWTCSQILCGFLEMPVEAG